MAPVYALDTLTFAGTIYAPGTELPTEPVNYMGRFRSMDLEALIERGQATTTKPSAKPKPKPPADPPAGDQAEDLSKLEKPETPPAKAEPEVTQEPAETPETPETPEEPPAPAKLTAKDLKGANKAQLLELCAERSIEPAAKATNAELVKLLTK